MRLSRPWGCKNCDLKLNEGLCQVLRFFSRSTLQEKVSKTWMPLTYVIEIFCDKEWLHLATYPNLSSFRSCEPCKPANYLARQYLLTNVLTFNTQQYWANNKTRSFRPWRLNVNWGLTTKFQPHNPKFATFLSLGRALNLHCLLSPRVCPTAQGISPLPRGCPHSPGDVPTA